MRTLAQQDGSFLRRCESQSGSFVSFEQRYSDRQNKNSCGVVGRPPHHKRFTPVHVRLPLNTGDEIKAKERRNQIRPREGTILQMPAQRERRNRARQAVLIGSPQASPRWRSTRSRCFPGGARVRAVSLDSRAITAKKIILF